MLPTLPPLPSRPRPAPRGAPGRGLQCPCTYRKATDKHQETELTAANEEVSDNDSNATGSSYRGNVNEETLAGTRQTVIAFFKSFIASGLLFLPDGFHKGGVLYAALQFGLVAVLALVGMLLLLRTKHAIVHATGCSPKLLDFSTIGRIACGRTGQVALNTAQVLAQMGFCTVYVAFMGQTMHGLASAVS